jgi:hypothetical protein
MLVLGATGLQAQDNVNASGGNASGSGGTVEYSVGQIVFQTHTGANGSVAEGVQQPYEISVITAIRETEGITLSASAYPNPVSDNLILEMEDFELANLRFQLFDITGKLLQSGDITGNRTYIAMGDLFPATYIVKIIRKNIEVKTFKIIKY